MPRVQGGFLVGFAFSYERGTPVACGVPETGTLWDKSSEWDYMGTSLKRNSAPLGPYSKNMPGTLWWS